MVESRSVSGVCHDDDLFIYIRMHAMELEMEQRTGHDSSKTLARLWHDTGKKTLGKKTLGKKILARRRSARRRWARRRWQEDTRQDTDLCDSLERGQAACPESLLVSAVVTLIINQLQSIR